MASSSSLLRRPLDPTAADEGSLLLGPMALDKIAGGFLVLNLGTGSGSGSQPDPAESPTPRFSGGSGSRPQARSNEGSVAATVAMRVTAVARARDC